METFVQSEHYQYLRMDGGTGVASRQPLINKFNEVSEKIEKCNCFSYVYILCNYCKWVISQFWARKQKI